MRSRIIFVSLVLGILLSALVVSRLQLSMSGDSVPSVQRTEAPVPTPTIPTSSALSEQQADELSPTPDPFIEQTVPVRVDPKVLQKWTVFAANIAPAVDVSDAEKVPLYPTAQQVVTRSSTLQHQPEPAIHEYRTTDSAQDVAGFYQAVLARRGWQLIEEHARLGYPSLEFQWSDSKDIAPCKLRFLVSLDAAGEWGSYKREGPTGVYTTLERWPLAGKVPVYPGAQDIEVKRVPEQGSHRDQLTTYVTTEEPVEIEEFYKTTLAKCGWGYGNYAGKDVRNFGSITEGLVFFFSSGGPHGALYSSVSITAKRNSNGQTYVEMLASGVDLPQ